MDDLAAHKVAGVREAVEATGAEVAYLPPYGPDRDPIEPVFAKLKTLLRKAQTQTVDARWTTSGSLRDPFERTECANYIANTGYAQPNRKPL